MDPRIKEVAKSVRAWADTLPDKYDYPKNLGGLCGIASRKLFREFSKRRIQARIACRPGHAFVVLPDYGVLVDVTATQFGGKEIEIRKLSEIKDISHWDLTTCTLYKSAQAFLNFQRSNPKWCICEVRIGKCPKREYNGCY